MLHISIIIAYFIIAFILAKILMFFTKPEHKFDGEKKTNAGMLGLSWPFTLPMALLLGILFGSYVAFEWLFKKIL